MSVADLVDVRLEDLLLRVVLLHLARGRLLAELAGQALVGAIDQVGVHVPDELLRDRAGSAGVAAYGVLQRAGDADDVHAVVLIEALILHRDERLADVLGQRPYRDQRPLLRAQVTDQRAVACEHEG